MTQLHRYVISAVLWTSALGLMVAQTFGGRHDDMLADWSVLVAVAAGVTTFIAIVVRERLRNETIAGIVCKYAEQNVDRIH